MENKWDNIIDKLLDSIIRNLDANNTQEAFTNIEMLGMFMATVVSADIRT